MGSYRLGEAKKKIATEVCSVLEAEGRLDAHNLVDVSRPEDAPLHSEFEWNDAIAGEKYREHQARNIIQQIVVYTEKKEPIRKYVHLYSDEPTYHPIELVLKQPDMHAQMLANAKRELESFRRKYSQLKELKAVFNAIDELE